MLLLFVLAGILGCASSGGIKDACLHPWPHQPPMFCYVSGSYQTKVEVKFHDNKDKIWWVEEAYDVQNMMGMTRITSEGGQVTTVYYYWRTKQLFFVQGTTCKVLKSDDQNLLGTWMVDYTTTFVYGPSALIWLTWVDAGFIDNVTDYNSHVRWQPSSNWTQPFDGKTLWVEYSFQGDQAWSYPYDGFESDTRTNQTAPLRLDAWQQDPYAAANIFLQTTYDFFLFRPQIDHTKRTQFMVPLDLHCPGREAMNPDLDKPQLPPEFQFSAEVLTGHISIDPPEDVQYVSGFDVYYSSKLSLLRLDLTAWDDTTGRFHRFRVIFDMASGVKYSIDTATGGCQMCAVDGICGPPLPEWLHVDKFFAGPEALLGVDLHYVHAGDAFVVRGIPASAWIASDKMSELGLHPGKEQGVVSSILFSQESGVFPQDQKRLVRITRSTYDVVDGDWTLTHAVDINVMGYQTSVGRRNIFDVPECFVNPADRKYFKFHFATDASATDGVLDGHTLEFEEELYDQLIRYLPEVSPVRMSQMRLEVSDVQQDVNATLLFLEDVPAMLRFVRGESKYDYAGHLDWVMPSKVATPSECAEAAVRERCESFCLSGTRCYLSLSRRPRGTEVARCPRWVRSVQNDTRPRTPTGQVFRDVQRVVGDGRVFIYISRTPEQAWFTADRVQELDGTDGTSLWDRYGGGFYLLEARARLTDRVTKEVLSGLDAGECARQCDTRRTLDCRSFATCVDNQCYLSTLQGSRQVTQWNVVRDDRCTIYAKKYIDEYTEMGGDLSIDEDRKTVGGKSQEECAYLCSTELSFTCRSFEFCPEWQRCNLHSLHFYDAGSRVRNGTGCWHFSRNYVVDFRPYLEEAMEANGLETVTDVSVPECAKACVDVQGYGCQSFDFCTNGDSSTRCSLKSAYHTSKGVRMTPDKSCNHYSRENYGDMNRQEFEESRHSGQDGYTAGAMIGMAAGATLLGAALAGLACHLRQKDQFRRKRLHNTTD